MKDSDTPDYGAGCGTAQVISFLGWVGLVISIIGVSVTVAPLIEGTGGVWGPRVVLAVMPWAVGILVSITFVAFGQRIRATFDMAEHTAQAVQSLKQSVALLARLERADQTARLVQLLEQLSPAAAQSDSR